MLFFEVFVEFECCDDECGDWCHRVPLFLFLSMMYSMGFAAATAKFSIAFMLGSFVRGYLVMSFLCFLLMM